MARTDGLRRERDGDLVPTSSSHEPAPATPPAHQCWSISGSPRGSGWLGEDPDGFPIPCPACKPELARRRLPPAPMQPRVIPRPQPTDHTTTSSAPRGPAR